MRTAAYLSLVLLLLLLEGRDCSCPPRVRKEWRDMTTAEQNLYLDGVQALKSSGAYDTFPPIHSAQASLGHGNANFLPWHRAYLFEFEEALRALGSPYDCLTIPFWDWTQDAGSIPSQLAAPVFKTNAFGAAVGDSGTGCVLNGVAQSWNINGGVGGCLQRRTSASSLSFTTQASLASVITSNPSYSSFRPSLEGGPHGTVHVFVGGQMGTVASSPEDPLFWLHHCFVDMAWALWQACHGYDNISPASTSILHNSWSGLSDLNATMTPWTWTPRQTHSTVSMGYSYQWGRSAGLSHHLQNSGSCGAHLTHTLFFLPPPPPCDFDTCVSCTSTGGYGWCKHPLGGYCAESQGSCPSAYWYNPTNWIGRGCRGWFVFPWPIKFATLERIPEIEWNVDPKLSAQVATKWECALSKAKSEQFLHKASQTCTLPEPTDPREGLRSWFEQSNSKVALEDLEAGKFDPVCGWPKPYPSCDPYEFPGGSLTGTPVKISWAQGRASVTVQEGDFVELNNAKLAPFTIDFTSTGLRLGMESGHKGLTGVQFEFAPVCNKEMRTIKHVAVLDGSTAGVSASTYGNSVRVDFPQEYTTGGVEVGLMFFFMSAEELGLPRPPTLEFAKRV